jgi:hypothetical protein
MPKGVIGEHHSKSKESDILKRSASTERLLSLAVRTQRAAAAMFPSLFVLKVTSSETTSGGNGLSKISAVTACPRSESTPRIQKSLKPTARAAFAIRISRFA